MNGEYGITLNVVVLCYTENPRHEAWLYQTACNRWFTFSPVSPVNNVLPVDGNLDDYLLHHPSMTVKERRDVMVGAAVCQRLDAHVSSEPQPDQRGKEFALRLGWWLSRFVTFQTQQEVFEPFLNELTEDYLAQRCLGTNRPRARFVRRAVLTVFACWRITALRAGRRVLLTLLPVSLRNYFKRLIG